MTRVSISKNLEKKLLFIFSLAPVSHDTSIILLGWAHFHLRFLHISQIGVFGSDLDHLGPKKGSFWGHRREKRPRSHQSLLRFIPWSFPDSCNIKPSRASQNGGPPPRLAFLKSLFRFLPSHRYLLREFFLYSPV